MPRATPPIGGYQDIERVCPVCGRTFITSAFLQSVTQFRDARGYRKRVFLCRESCYERFESERKGR